MPHAIFVLIAGTYTPVCLATLRGGWGWSVLGIVWGLAFVGATLKLFFGHLPRWLSTALYVGMGWTAVIAIVPLVQSVPVSGMMWLVSGGVFYTLGAVIYAEVAEPRGTGLRLPRGIHTSSCWPAASRTSCS